MQLVCSQCQHPFKATDLRMSMGVAVCSVCGSIEKLGDSERPKTQVAQPARFKVEDRYDGFTVSWRWFEPQHIFMAFFCVFWDGFLVMWYSMGLSQLGSDNGPGIAMLLFPLLHVGVGVFLTYSTITGFLNQTILNLSNGTLNIDHRPLWWPGRKQFATENFKQFYVVERVNRRKNGVSTHYELMALNREGVIIPILKNLKTIEEGKFLEQRLEEKLNIKDQSVAGEA